MLGIVYERHAIILYIEDVAKRHSLKLHKNTQILEFTRMYVLHQIFKSVERSLNRQKKGEIERYREVINLFYAHHTVNIILESKILYFYKWIYNLSNQFYCFD